MHILLGLIAGLIFGIGLVISGMADPAKVINFLDIAGTWDPSLAFVMGGATVTTFVGYRMIFGRPRPVLSERFNMPSQTRIDAPLLTGSALFGIGWGIGGFCPGPAWVALPLMAPGTLVFMVFMIAGFALGRFAKPPFQAVNA